MVKEIYFWLGLLCRLVRPNKLYNRITIQIIQVSQQVFPSLAFFNPWFISAQNIIPAWRLRNENNRPQLFHYSIVYIYSCVYFIFSKNKEFLEQNLFAFNYSHSRSFEFPSQLVTMFILLSFLFSHFHILKYLPVHQMLVLMVLMLKLNQQSNEEVLIIQ